MTKSSKNFSREHKLPGKHYHLSEAEKAVRENVSSSFLAKDRLKEKPVFDFARRGRLVRYSED